jgi:hypothetical protein
MSAIFLSASVPQEGRGDFFETADPFLIQCAVRELFIAVIKKKKVVWGGHPAITPMVWAICQDLQVDYSKAVVLYQSLFFEDMFPEENKHFGNVVHVDKVPEDREASLELMRREMLSRVDLEAAVFIGGMEGIESEYKIFQKFHPEAKVLPLVAPGGAARQLAERLGVQHEDGLSGVNFSRLFQYELVGL